MLYHFTRLPTTSTSFNHIRLTHTSFNSNLYNSKLLSKTKQVHNKSPLKMGERIPSENQDLVTSTAPMYYLSKVIGLVICDPIGDVGNRTFVKGKYHLLYNITYLVIHLLLIAASFYFRLSNYTEYKYDPKIVLFNIYTSLFISIVVVVCHHIFQNSFHKTINDLNELDKRFAAFGLNTDHRAVFRGGLGLTTFLLITALWFSVITTMSTNLKDFYYWLLFFAQYLVTMTMKSQFCGYNVIIKYRFQTLDDKLREVIDSTKDIVEGNNKIILVGSANKQNMTTQSIYSPSYKVLTLSEFHSKLFNIAKRINLFYSVQILLIIGKYFVEVTATLYYNLQKLYRDQQTYDLNTFLLLIWAVMNAIDLLILVYACDSMCSTVSILGTSSQSSLKCEYEMFQANNSKITLHKLNLNSKDTEMKREVSFAKLFYACRYVSFVGCMLCVNFRRDQIYHETFARYSISIKIKFSLLCHVACSESQH